MCRHATVRLSPAPESASSARAFCRQTLESWQLRGMLGDAQLVVSELVTNGVLHARTALALSLSVEDCHLEVAVTDGSPQHPDPRPHRDDLAHDLRLLLAVPAELTVDDRDPRLHVGAAGSVAGGRGLLMVESLTSSWGVAPRGDGKAVWARLPAPEPSAFRRRRCSCGDGPAGVQLASGRSVVHRDDG